jgi:hypothetical protein
MLVGCDSTRIDIKNKAIDIKNKAMDVLQDVDSKLKQSDLPLSPKEGVNPIKVVHRPRGTYYGMAFDPMSMAFNNDTVEIAIGILSAGTFVVLETKTYKINWQEYDAMYATSTNIQCVPLTEITTGKIQCFWFKYFDNYDFIQYGFKDFDNKLQTTELHKDD